MNASTDPVATLSTTSIQAGQKIFSTVGYKVDQISTGVTILVAYDADLLEYGTYEKHNDRVENDYLSVDQKEDLLEIRFSSNDEEEANKQINLCIISFKLKDNVQVGTAINITITLKDFSGSIAEDYPHNTVNKSIVKTVTVAAKPTATPATPTPTPTKTPVRTPTPTPTKTPGETAGTTGGGILPGTSDLPTDASPESSGDLPTDETASPTPTTTPTKGVSSGTPETTDDQALLIKTGALGFWMLVVLIVGIWIGIAVGFLIWGRKRGRHVRRSKIIGTDDF